MSLNKESNINQKIYNNFTIGTITIIVSIFSPIILPMLGNFIAPFLFLAGVIAVLISKVNWIIKIITVLIPLFLLIIFWDEYVTWVMTYLENVNSKYQN